MKVTNFLKQTLAFLKGDEAGVIAAQNERKSRSAFKRQISGLESKQVDAEAAVEDAQDALTRALYPTTRITNNETYIRSITSAQQTLDSAKATLEAINESLAYYAKLSDSTFAEVEA